MKTIFTFLLLLLADLTIAQTAFPDFLEGTWKMEDKEIYEHWDKLKENSLKGFSYQLQNDRVIVSEYLAISQKENKIFYRASVLNQNSGKDILFQLTKNDSAFIFENPHHDFPKKIVYQKLNDSVIFVQLSGGRNRLAYKMEKLKVLPAKKDSSFENPNYDAALASKLGADDYGMKSFIFVVLKTGSNQTTDKNFISEKFKGHLQNINYLVELDKLIVAGPFGKNDKNYRGIFILQNVAGMEEASELLQTDPAIKAGLLDFELFNWYGSAALPAYLKYSDKIWKVKP